MKTINKTKDPDTNDGIYPATDATIRDFQAAHEQRVREWLCRSPFGALVKALRNGTRQDQLKCMRQVESWLLRCHPEVLFGRYTRKLFLEEMRSLLGLFGLSLGSGFLREYRNMTPRRQMTQVS